MLRRTNAYLSVSFTLQAFFAGVFSFPFPLGEVRKYAFNTDDCELKSDERGRGVVRYAEATLVSLECAETALRDLAGETSGEVKGLRSFRPVEGTSSLRVGSTKDLLRFCKDDLGVVGVDRSFEPRVAFVAFDPCGALRRAASGAFAGALRARPLSAPFFLADAGPLKGEPSSSESPSEPSEICSAMLAAAFCAACRREGPGVLGVDMEGSGVCQRKKNKNRPRMVMVDARASDNANT